MNSEPMYLISESELCAVDDGECDMTTIEELVVKIRARGPVSAQQQAPANPCLENGCTDIENCDEICEHQRLYSPAWLAQHDAAIAAQTRIDARKEWEEEHTPKFHAEHPEEFSPWYNVEMVAARVGVAREQARKEGYAEGAAAERERVLHDLGAKCDWAITVKKQSPRTGQAQLAYGQVLKWIQEIRNEALRSQPEKQQEGERE